MSNPVIVCICGSMRFADTMMHVARTLTLRGQIVLMPFVMPGSVTEEEKARLDELHLRKIDLANYVFVVNAGGYVGESTFREIAYSIAMDKEIEFHDAERGAELLRDTERGIGRLVMVFDRFKRAKGT